MILRESRNWPRLSEPPRDFFTPRNSIVRKLLKTPGPSCVSPRLFSALRRSWKLIFGQHDGFISYYWFFENFRSHSLFSLSPTGDGWAKQSKNLKFTQTKLKSRKILPKYISFVVIESPGDSHGRIRFIMLSKNELLGQCKRSKWIRMEVSSLL